MLRRIHYFVNKEGKGSIPKTSLSPPVTKRKKELAQWQRTKVNLFKVWIVMIIKTVCIQNSLQIHHKKHCINTTIKQPAIIT
uniref:Uncharacterized protein n=1 Tax=Arundo donax TaxID=35708 RepID=A0A0A9GJC2_ARUDO